MKIRALKTTSGSYGSLPRGHIADVPDWEAKELIALGYAIEEQPIERKLAAPQNVKREADNDAPVFPDAPTGGQNGSEKPQSSSRRGRPRRNAR